jgi:hypothetical protein
MEQRRITEMVPATPEVRRSFVEQERRKADAEAKRRRKAQQRQKASRKANR